MGAHLGDAVAAYADRRLDPRAHAAAQQHLESCPACRDAVAAQREVRLRLASMGCGTSVTPDLVERLRVLGSTAQLPGAGPSTDRRDAQSPGRASAVGPLHRLRLPAASTVVGAASVVAVGLGAAWALGGPTDSGERVRPAVSTFVSQHGTGSSTTLDDPALDAVSAAYHP